MDTHLFNDLLKRQGELAIEYNKQRKRYKYEKQKEEKHRWKNAKVKTEIVVKPPSTI